jgi:hypothetical protein
LSENEIYGQFERDPSHHPVGDASKYALLGFRLFQHIPMLWQDLVRRKTQGGFCGNIGRLREQFREKKPLARF